MYKNILISTNNTAMQPGRWYVRRRGQFAKQPLQNWKINPQSATTSSTWSFSPLSSHLAGGCAHNGNEGGGDPGLRRAAGSSRGGGGSGCTGGRAVKSCGRARDSRATVADLRRRGPMVILRWRAGTPLRRRRKCSRARSRRCLGTRARPYSTPQPDPSAACHLS
jgi:hypothetical protein